MKIRISTQQTNQGSAIAVTFMTCIVLGLLMGSYLYLVQGQRQSVARSQSWNQAIVVAEAGVDEAMALMNSGVVGTNFAVFPWKNAGGGNFTNRPTPSQFTNSYYSVTINTSGTNPVITSTSYVPAPISKTLLSRTVRVQTRPRPTFPVKGPMIVKQTYNANGNNVNSDSFDSTLGSYNPATAGTNGDIVSLLTNVNSVVIGNGKVNGTVRTPPGGTSGSSGTTATIGSNGKVGDTTWINGSSYGFEPGHFKDDFTLSDFPDASAPNPPVWYSPTGGNGSDGLTYTYSLGSQGAYMLGTTGVPADLTGSVYVGYSNTVLYVTGNVSIGGNSGGKKNAPPEIHIAPGASLTLYVGGTSTSIAGNGVVNDTDLARNFQYYGLPNNTSISITGNGAFYGTIYAPEADFSLKGSGNSTADDFTGSSITKTTTMTGNFNFHYDDSLGYLTTLGGYDATSWEEL